MSRPTARWKPAEYWCTYGVLMFGSKMLMLFDATAAIGYTGSVGNAGAPSRD